MTLNIATATKLDLLIADIQGEIKYTVLPTRKARKSELLMSRTNGPRTNTNRRGQAYSGHATHAQGLWTLRSTLSSFSLCVVCHHGIHYHTRASSPTTTLNLEKY